MLLKQQRLQKMQPSFPPSWKIKCGWFNPSWIFVTCHTPSLPSLFLSSCFLAASELSNCLIKAKMHPEKKHTKTNKSWLLYSVNVGNIYLMRVYWILHSQCLPLISSSAPQTNPWTFRNISVFATTLEMSREFSSHIYTLHVRVTRFGPWADCGWKSDRMLCRVHKCKPYNPIKTGQFVTLTTVGVVMLCWQWEELNLWQLDLVRCPRFMNIHRLSAKLPERSW